MSQETFRMDAAVASISILSKKRADRQNGVKLSHQVVDQLDLERELTS